MADPKVVKEGQDDTSHHGHGRPSTVSDADLLNNAELGAHLMNHRSLSVEEGKRDLRPLPNHGKPISVSRVDKPKL